MWYALAISAAAVICLCSCAAESSSRSFERYVLTYDSPVDPSLQANVEQIDTRLRERFSMTTEQTAVGVLDLTAG
ncbi:MAG: hypothetical protein GX616_12520, partial [Planctomycetes bacterium]|nr:hypothetical protein [Planctomycetota bacterium]